jgi:hypothetical protein
MNELQKQFSAMVAGLVKPGADIIAALTPEKAHLWHMATGLVGELPELLQAERRSDKPNFLEECGDALFYAEGTLQCIDENIHGVEDGKDQMSHEETLHDAAGEIVDAVKRHVIYGKELDVQRLRTNLHTFVGGLDWFLDCFNLCRADALAHNYAKLGKRYAGHKYTDAQAVARADKAGEEAK